MGPIYSTQSKSRFGPPLGPEIIEKIKSRIKIPVIAIGGINSGNLKEIIHYGADGAAFISDVFAKHDIGKSVVTLKNTVENIN